MPWPSSCHLKTALSRMTVGAMPQWICSLELTEAKLASIPHSRTRAARAARAVSMEQTFTFRCLLFEITDQNPAP